MANLMKITRLHIQMSLMPFIEVFAKNELKKKTKFCL